VLGATAGEIQISAAGRLENIGQISAGTTIQSETSDSVRNSGEIVADMAVQASVTETFDNTGGLIDAGNVDITADLLINRGKSRIYGDSINIVSTSLENGEDGGDAAVVAARQQLKLGVQTLNNENGATLYSDGGLAIGGELDAARDVKGTADVINNHGGVIDAVADIDITASQLNNTNTDFSTRLAQTGNENIQEYALVGSPNRYRPDEITLLPDSNDDVNYLVTPEGISDAYNRFDFNRTMQETEVTASSPGQILAGGNIHISAGDLVNDNSRILAGGALTADLAALINTETPGSRISTDAGTVSTFTRRHKKGRDSTRVAVNPYNPAPATQTISLGQAGYAGNTLTAGSGTQTPLLSSHLFKLAPHAAAGYLVETDPRFINRRLFLSSDFVLQQLSFDHVVTQKRLGDGFYEQRLVREQVARLTGRRFLKGFANDEEQFRALLNAGVTAVEELNLRPGIALSAAQVAQLTSDVVLLVEQDITLPNGDSTRALVPRLYARLQDGDLNGNGGLLAAGIINLAANGDISNSARIAGREMVSLTADNINNVGGVISSLSTELHGRSNITVEGGQVSGDHRLMLDAGRDITLTSTTNSQNSAQGQRTNIKRLAGLYVSNPGGVLNVSAGRNLNLHAAQIVHAGVGGSTVLSAGNDIESGTVTEHFTHNVLTDANNFRKESGANETGSVIQATGDIGINAGNDVRLKAATVSSEQGRLSVIAGNDVIIAAAKASRELDEGLKTTSKGFLSSTTRVRRDQVTETLSLASSLGAERVSIQSGNDIGLTGSSVVGSEDVTVTAEHDVSIVNALEQRTERLLKQKSKSGLFSSGGFGVTIGTQQQSVHNDNKASTAAGSTLGSITGNLAVTAGKAYRQTGSDVLTLQGNVDINAEKVDIIEATDRYVSQQVTEFRQSGLSISITNPVISAVQTGSRLMKAARETSDSRMKVLAAGATALAAKDAYEAVKAGQGGTIDGKENQIPTTDAEGNPSSRDANAADKVGGVNLAISLGSSKSSSRSSEDITIARSSQIIAGGDINITAEGAGKDSDLNVVGSQIKAGRDVLLKAENKINLLAAANISTLKSKNKSSSASVGISIGTDGLLFRASAAKGKGKENGQDISWTETTVQGGNTAQLESGGDTNLKGAVVSGNQVTADVGKNLNIQSLQDISTYDAKQKNIGGSLSIGYGKVGGSFNFSSSDIESGYASVVEQSGIKTGDSGFQIDVDGNTDLKGAVIASTQAAIDDQLNRLATGTLTMSNIENKAEYKAGAGAVSIGMGLQAGEPQLSGAGIGTDSANAESTSLSGVSGITGNEAVRTSDSSGHIVPIFDADKVQREINAQATITQAFGQRASRVVGDYAVAQRKVLYEQRKQAETDEQKTVIEAKINEVNLQERVMNILIGAVTGAGQSAVTKESLSIAAAEMRKLMIESSMEFSGVTDGTTTLTNQSGESVGVRGDGFKLGGARIDLDLLCGADNNRCATKDDGSLQLNAKDQVVFKEDLVEFLKTDKGRELAGVTGGVQGWQGTLFGMPYKLGSWQDKLIEAFSGTHDMVGGELSGLYDAQGNATRGRSNLKTKAQDTWSATGAIVVSTPFASAEFLSPEVWNAISILLRNVK